MNKTIILVLAGIMALCTSAFALTLDDPLPDPMQEARAHAIFLELRCVVCQSESLADSPAEVARDMRREIRAQVAAGKSHDAIIAYFTARYGDFVLMRPPLNSTTAMLWLAPWGAILVGGMLSIWYFRRRGASK